MPHVEIDVIATGLLMANQLQLAELFSKLFAGVLQVPCRGSARALQECEINTAGLC